MKSEPNVWVIRGGREGEFDDALRNKGRIFLGWELPRDISKLDREELKAALAKESPSASAGKIANHAGQLFRFAREIREGDLVAYPSKVDRHVHLGRVTGPYRFDRSFDPEHPHTRTVEWVTSTARSQFSQGALNELGSLLTFFQIKTHAADFRAAASGKLVPTPVEEDETVEQVVHGAEETTRDYIRKVIATKLHGHPFAELVADLLRTMGFRTRVARPGPDGGVDIVAHRDELGLEPPVIKVQVKSSEGSVGDPTVSQLKGKVGPEEFGLFVTLGTFTTEARRFERNQGRLRLIDGEEVISLILEHYEQLDSRYRGLISLKRVYVPNQVEED